MYYPFRKLGQVTTDVPFIIQNRGQQFFITTCVGNSFQIYDVIIVHSAGKAPGDPKRTEGKIDVGKIVTEADREIADRLSAEFSALWK